MGTSLVDAFSAGPERRISLDKRLWKSEFGVISPGYKMDNPRIGLIGAGQLGSGLALALAANGYNVAAVASRTPASALASQIPGCTALEGPQELAEACDLVFITTPDEVINQVASQVEWRPDQGVVHCCGAHSLELLEPAAKQGAATGSFHPFQTFAFLEMADDAVDRMRGISFAVDGTGWVEGFLRKLASRLGGKALALKPEDRALYHASAVLVCSHLVALLRATTEVWGAMGVPQEAALPVILPIAKATLANVSRVGIEASLTGPVVRGDLTTIQKHLEALEERAPRVISVYCCLALESLTLAAARVDEDTLDAMKRLVTDWLRKPGSPGHQCDLPEEAPE